MADGNAFVKFGVGQPVRRFEDQRFLTGAGQYVDDRTMPGLLHAVILRSPQAHAKLRRVDATAARAAPGVAGIFTGVEWKAAGLGPLPGRNFINHLDGRPVAPPPRFALAVDRVRHVGDCVAIVVAATRTQAEDALELIEIDYEELPAIASPVDALAPGAPAVWAKNEWWEGARDEAALNTAFVWRVGDGEKTAAAIAAARHVVRTRLVNNRLVIHYMEPRGCIAWRDETGRMVFGGSLQNAPNFRELLCLQFGWKLERLRVVADDVGGGFGGKNQLQPEHCAALFAADRLGRPVKWINDRIGSFQSDVHGRDLVSDVELALDAEGRFLALRAHTISNMGAYLSTYGSIVPTNATAAVMGGVYDLRAVFMEVRGVWTHTVPVDAYRGAGRPEANYILERTIDVAARQLGLSPIELRRRNFIKLTQLPYTTAMGRVLDSGDFAGVFDRALKLADHAGLAARKAEARSRGRRRGFGIAPYLEATLGKPTESARIEFHPDGTATLIVGSQSNGQGHETTFPQIVAAELGIDPSRFRYRQADTDLAPDGGGHGGSRSTQHAGGAMLKATEAIIAKGKLIAANLLEAAAVDIEWSPGEFRVIGTDRRIAFDRVVRAAFDATKLPAGVGPGLDETGTYERTAFNYPNGCHVAEIELDPETGAVQLVGYWVVDDFGRIINPMIVRGQVVGGAVQGIGQALLEQVVYESGTAQLLTASPMDYCLPRADDLPAIAVELFEGAPTTTNPLGVKGAGEAGATGAPQAAANAVLDALTEWGIPHLDMPLTREKIWRAIAAAR